MVNEVYVLPTIISFFCFSSSQEESTTSPEEFNDSTTLGTSSSEPSGINSPLPPRRKKAKVDMAIEGDKLLLKSLKEIQEAARERQAQKDDMDMNFALEVAGRLRRLPPRQNAYVKL